MPLTPYFPIKRIGLITAEPSAKKALLSRYCLVFAFAALSLGLICKALKAFLITSGTFSS